MMGRKERYFAPLINVSVEELVPPDHFYRHLERTLDLSVVREFVQQTWCDRLNCWDCYRLMKLGEALGYRSLTNRCGLHLIDEGREAWSAFVLSQRPFLVMLATEAAIAQCNARGLDVPDLSGAVKQLVRIPPPSP